MECSNSTNNNSGNAFQLPVVIVSTVSSSLSIIGSILIILSYVLIPEIRTPIRKLLVCLTLADFLTAFGILLSTIAYFAEIQVCFVQSIITTYSSLVSFYLTVAIAIHLFLTVIFQDGRASTLTFILSANAISWLIPAIIVISAERDGVIGQETNETLGTGPWCWLKTKHQHYTFWVFFTGKGWEFMCYLLTTSLYVILKFYMYLRYRFHRLSAVYETLRDDDQNYLYVWFVLYVLRLWGSIRAMMSLAEVHHIPEAFLYMQALGDPGQAFCNCILFCFLDKAVRSRLFGNCIGVSQTYTNEERASLMLSDSFPGYGAQISEKITRETVDGGEFDDIDMPKDGSINSNYS